jgi:glutaredoxin
MGKILIYYLSYCPHSIEALETLRSIPNIELEEKLSDNNKFEIKQNFINKYNHSTFPLILYKSSTTGKEYYIGGNDKFQEIYKLVNINRLIPIKEISQYTTLNNRTKEEQKLICYLLIKNKLLY